uniref:WD repeat-containing protein 91 n=1 Tax=Eptatretus burgeri TaxID=7764 RepID=A0A8C4WVH0_EPTBU
MAHGVERADELVRQYLLFRGFPGTLRAFEAELRTDRDRKIVPWLQQAVNALDLVAVRDFWALLEPRLLSRLDHAGAMAAQRLRLSLGQAFVAAAAQGGRMDKVQEALTWLGPEASTRPDWLSGFGAVFVPSPSPPSRRARRPWQDTFWLSLHNFLSVLFHAILSSFRGRQNEYVYWYGGTASAAELCPNKMTAIRQPSFHMQEEDEEDSIYKFVHFYVKILLQWIRCICVFRICSRTTGTMALSALGNCPTVWQPVVVFLVHLVFLPCSLFLLRFDASGRHVASLDADGIVKVWATVASRGESRSPILSLAWSHRPDRLVRSNSVRFTLLLFLFTSILIQTRQHQFGGSTLTMASSCVAFNHNGTLLAAGGTDGVTRVFDVARGECLLKWPAHQGSVWALEFSGDETSIYTMGEDNRFVQWSLHSPSSCLVGFALLFSYYQMDASIMLQNDCDVSPIQLTSQSLKPCLSLGSHASPVTAVDWSPGCDCSSVISASRDGRVQLSTLLYH